MQRSCGNIYREARDNAKMTREKASELLNISSSMLENYEKEIGRRDATKPHDDIVIDMIRIYNLDWQFGYEHLRYGSEIGQKLIPKFKEECFHSKVLRVKKKIKDVLHLKDALLDIACSFNGKIDKNENDTWEKIQKAVMKLAIACISLAFVKNKYQKSNKKAS